MTLSLNVAWSSVKAGLLVVPTVRRAVGGEYVEVHEVDVAADHVGLDQLLVGVVADLIRRAVGDLEVDAVALVDPEEERRVPSCRPR